jgi:hypothetical protein
MVYLILTTIRHCSGMNYVTTRTLLMLGILSVLTMIALSWTVTPAYARAECARISRVVGQSMLTNTCGECRSIQVIKDRSGNALPSMRTFVLNGGEQFPLPFKGTGGTRVTIDAPCQEQTKLDQIREKEVANAVRRCIFPMQTARGLVLVNGCDSCRAIVVERRYMDGREIHKSYAMQSKDVLAFSEEGAVAAQIIHDAACHL